MVVLGTKNTELEDNLVREEKVVNLLLNSIGENYIGENEEQETEQNRNFLNPNDQEI